MDGERLNPKPDDPRLSQQHRKNLAKLISGISHRHRPYVVFTDFVEMAALSLSNAVDKSKYEEREARYHDVIKRYTKDELAAFPKMLAELVEALEAGPHDALGMLYSEMELHNTGTGQFFTPYNLCRMMAHISLDDTIKATIAERGYITTQEPAVGGGAMVIALAHEMRDMGLNYQKALHVAAVDVDPVCVHMSYVQFSLLHIPAIVVHGNSLAMTEQSRWHTPAHVMGGWSFREPRSVENALLAPVVEEETPIEKKAERPVEATIPEEAKPQAEPIAAREKTYVERLDEERKKPKQLTLF